MPSGTIELRKMTEAEFSKYREPQLEAYAQDLARNFKRPIEQVRVEANRQLDQLLKDGLSTPGHFLFNVIEKETDATVGHTWVYVEKEKKRAFLYDIRIEESYRGKGYGRETLRLVEERVMEMGITQLGLHVFADNEVAIKLYKTQGYYVASFNMQKELGTGSASDN